ncbi:MAG: hypothetical protein HFJ45_08835 [Clostridia bacterium]|nr:hypothetical protein [Clostridia bacterium]
MIDLREKIKEIINSEREKGHFLALNSDSANLIQQIFEIYGKEGLHQDFENIPKNAELIFVAAPTRSGKR